MFLAFSSIPMDPICISSEFPTYTGISIHNATAFADSHIHTGIIFMQLSSKPHYFGVDKVWGGVLWSQRFLVFFLNFFSIFPVIFHPGLALLPYLA